MDRFSIIALMAVVMFTLSLSYPAPGSAYSSQTCGVSTTEMFELSGLSTIASDILEYEFNESKGVLAQAKCSDLKPDTCGMGACKDGWKCQENVTVCMCFPPN